MFDPSAAVGQKYWRVRGSGGGFFLQTADDTGINSGSYGIVFLRSGTMISQVQIMALNNPLTLTGTDATLWSGYTPANPLSIATKAYVDGATSVTPANPSAQVGTAAINGVATTYMRSDAAPAINEAMTPTWTGLHTHNTAVHINNPGGDAFIVMNSTVTGPTATISTASSGGSALSTLLLKSTSVSGGASLGFTNTSLGTDLKTWDIYQSDTTFNFRTSNDANSSNATWLTATRAAAAIAGIASNSGTGAWTHTGTLAVTGNVNVQGNISSTANLNPAGPTNSGAQLVAAPSLATIGFWDSTRTVNNRYAEWIWFEGALQARFKNDAGSSAVVPLSFTGGQAGGITAIASNSGSGAWTHTGTFHATGAVSFTASSTITAPTLQVASGGPQIELRCTSAAVNGQRWNYVADATSLKLSILNDAGTVGSGVWQVNRSGTTVTEHFFSAGGSTRLTITDTDLAAAVGYAPANALSLATKDYVDTHPGVGNGVPLTTDASRIYGTTGSGDQTTFPISGASGIAGLTASGVLPVALINQSASATYSWEASHLFLNPPAAAYDSASESFNDQILVDRDYVKTYVAANGGSGGSSGTYAPTLAAGGDTITNKGFWYTRVGDVVQVSGSVDLTPGSAGNVPFTITLPIASELAEQFDLVGSVVSYSGVSGDPDAYGTVFADAANNRANANLQVPNTDQRFVTVQFSYVVV